MSSKALIASAVFNSTTQGRKGVADKLFAHWFSRLVHAQIWEDPQADLHALQEIFLQAHSNHPYIFEPQSAQYLAHGDLWDHLYLQACETVPATTFLPLTLEMGSWLWIKKNPRQLFSRNGIFNPLINHRQQRVLRRHLSLLDFLSRAACSHAHWAPPPEQRAQRRADALAAWY